MSIQVSYKKQFLFGFILILIMLSIVEISMKIYDYFVPSCQFIESDVFNEINFELKREICIDNSKLVWNNSPLYLIPNQHFSTINVNSQGFRGDEPQTNSDYKIFMIGGSTTFGVGATSDDATIPAYLQQIISKNFNENNIEVINAGIPKAYSFTEKYLIKNSILNLNPNLLIIYDGWNDIGNDYEHYESSVDFKFTDQVIRKIRQTDIATMNVILKWYFNYKHDTTEIIQFNPNKIEEKVSLWKNTWEDICKLQEQNDFKILIVLQPLVGTGNKQLSMEEKDHLIHFDGITVNKHYQLYADALNELNNTCTTLDLRNGFDSHSETIFFDLGHVGDNGNQIIAKKIYEKISSIIKTDI
jgi:lysophospholipase L1-like esterase